MGGPKLLYTFLCSWLFWEQGGDLCCLQHLAGMVVCLSVTLPGGSAGITLAQEQQENFRVLLLCLLELSPQQGSDSRYLYCCVPFTLSAPWGGVYFKNLRWWGFISILSWWQMEGGRQKSSWFHWSCNLSLSCLSVQ